MPQIRTIVGIDGPNHPAASRYMCLNPSVHPSQSMPQLRTVVGMGGPNHPAGPAGPDPDGLDTGDGHGPNSRTPYGESLPQL